MAPGEASAVLLVSRTANDALIVQAHFRLCATYNLHSGRRARRLPREFAALKT